MPRIQIDYDGDNVEAVLTTDAVGRHWDIVIRTIREQSSEIVLESPHELRVPWWVFVAARKALGYQIAVADIETHFSASVRELLQRANDRELLLDNAQEVPELDQPDIDNVIRQNGFTRNLMPFQQRNLRSLCRLPVGATFSVPGAGKTTEALAFFSFFHTERSKLLVVAPKNAFPAWEEQVAICLPNGPRFVRLRFGRAAIERTLRELQPDLMLITYEQLPNTTAVVAKYLSRYQAFIFLDESHRIKGGEGKVRANAVLRIAPVASYKLLLSGTPLPNSTSDLSPQLKFIASEADVLQSDPISAIRPFFVRTRKSELGLPEPRRIIVPIPMREEQRKLYTLLKSEIARTAALANRDDRRALRKIGKSAVRLLQYVSNPSLLIGKIPELDAYLGEVIQEGDSPKLEWACRRARQLGRQDLKVIIWSSFVENVEILAERLGDLGADYIHGGVDAGSEAEEDTREAKIARFHNNDSAKVLVANPAACGEGISLHTVCHHAIYVDRTYNAAQYLQSEDRIHRIGSDAQKYIEILATPDSIDESVHRRLLQKIARMADALNDPDLRVTPIPIDPDSIDLDSDDVRDLLDHLQDVQEAA